MWRCFSVQFYVETTTSCKKNQHISQWFTDLRIRVSPFRNVYVNAADHMNKSDPNRKFKMTATIMTWGIPLRLWQSRRQWNILKTPIKIWIANLFIGDEKNCCQRRNFDRSAWIWPGFLLGSPPRDFKHNWIRHSLRSERRISKRVRFESY